MSGRRGLVMGVANDHSIAWGIARVLKAQGAELAYTYQGEAQAKRLRRLIGGNSTLMMPGDVEKDDELDAAFETLKREWGGLDFLVHAIAYSDKNELTGRYVDTSRSNFQRSLDISCYSFTAVAQRGAHLMTPPAQGGRGGSLLTLTYLGASRVMPNYNVMGVAKAALEASVRYLAADLGHDGIRVNAISAGPMRTLAGSAVGDARTVFKWNRAHSPLKKSVELDHVGGAALYLLSDLSAGVTGEIHFVDAGFNVVGMPPTADLKGWTAPENGSEGDNHGRRDA
ncbi:MAG: SDR family oxidoreductase [Alphaproteobacteria bacterium]|nr:SDR family oxidoreductase [Alphaproteobacteria bacterium]MBV9694758.1 SDR family oxidoreductase [Alphaproteobacteria bacterium]